VEARKSVGAFDKNRELQKSDTKAARLFRRFGQPALLLSWLPIIGAALVILAGGLKMDFKTFSIWTVCGKLLRYFVVAWGASAFMGKLLQSGEKSHRVFDN
jgi:membrane protein YqaA with SNARE-associated domain